MKERPGSERTRTEVLRDFRCDQILRAARRVIGGVGYADASIDRIASEAGVARSTVYVYFEGKDDLLNQCLAQNRVELSERVRESVEKARGIEPRLAAYLEALFEYIGDYREFFLGVMAVRGLDPFFGAETGTVPSELLGIREESQAVMARILEEGVTSGEIPERDLAQAGEVLGTMIYGSLIRRSLRGDAPPPRDEATALAHAFLYGIAGL